MNEATPWEMIVYGWTVGWTFACIWHVTIYAVAGVWKKYLKQA